MLEKHPSSIATQLAVTLVVNTLEVSIKNIQVLTHYILCVCVCVCVCYIQHGSEVYMCYIAFELQMIEKMQPIINCLLATNC